MGSSVCVAPASAAAPPLALALPLVLYSSLSPVLALYDAPHSFFVALAVCMCIAGDPHDERDIGLAHPTHSLFSKITPVVYMRAVSGCSTW